MGQDEVGEEVRGYMSRNLVFKYIDCQMKVFNSDVMKSMVLFF